eukprot:TRINITY_DN13320_c0_g1_i1.p1 TRINITY_DN13320_c0_g1~~TRINITY_DN13320_c0_g1_i1.p1  ORF type:complete len:393 (+),score=58.79 TRINITY_DN13320_c0_g1_i1:206-1384(+)
MNYQPNRWQSGHKLILRRYPPFKPADSAQPTQTLAPPKEPAAGRHRAVLTNILNLQRPKLTARFPHRGTSRKLHDEKENVSEGMREIFSGNIEMYEIGKEIGHGAYAVVKECYHKLNPRIKYAMKIYDKKELLAPYRRCNMDREIQILKTLKHANIVRLLESIEGETQVYLVFELIKGGSLYDYILSKEMHKLSEAETKRLFAQIIAAVCYFHHKGVAHRDLKLENILLDENRNVKIIDFGFSVVANSVSRLKAFCGTPSYMAPEIITKQEYLGPPADMWSLGIILYTMLSGKFPFKGANEEELFASIMKGIYVVPPEASPAARDFLSKLLNINPMERPTCDEMMKDAFVSAKPAFRGGYTRLRNSLSLTARTHGFELHHCLRFLTHLLSTS